MADGERRADPADAVQAADVARFQALSGRVRDALAPGAQAPAFDDLWAGVEARLAATQRPAAVPARPLWERILGDRPLLVLAPAGAFVVAAVLTWFLVLRPEPVSNLCFVDSYEAEDGSVLIEQDGDDAERPTVIWYVEEG